jgi:MurNAc alpha-1-phosphate uridylyltransferase
MSSLPAERPRVAMILAAGRGERMRPLTDATPKPLLKVRGQPLIERHVVNLKRAGFEKIVINLAWLGAQIRDFLGDGSRYGIAIAYSEESPQALDAGGGIFRALPLLSPEPFAVVNGDVFTEFPLGTLRLADDSDAHILLVPNPSYLKGDFGLENGRALAGAAQLYTFGCVAVYRAAFFAGCVDGAFPMKPLWLRSIASGRCSAELYTGPWEDVGTPERLAALNT